VFRRQGKQLKDISRAWANALEQSKIGKKFPHDFMKAAVRNLERVSVPRSVAMKLIGHKTESIYRRYAILAKQDLEDGLKRLASYRETLQSEEAEVMLINQKEKVND
jgi:hypothetical protein